MKNYEAELRKEKVVPNQEQLNAIFEADAVVMRHSDDWNTVRKTMAMMMQRHWNGNSNMDDKTYEVVDKALQDLLDDLDVSWRKAHKEKEDVHESIYGHRSDLPENRS